MKYDFNKGSETVGAIEFKKWLSEETIRSLKQDKKNNDPEALKGTIFLFINRSYEAHIPESDIAEIFGVAVVRAGYSEQEENFVFDWFGTFAEIASKMY